MCAEISQGSDWNKISKKDSLGLIMGGKKNQETPVQKYMHMC